jgi:hypothetical protein
MATPDIVRVEPLPKRLDDQVALAQHYLLTASGVTGLRAIYLALAAQIRPRLPCLAHRLASRPHELGLADVPQQEEAAPL